MGRKRTAGLINRGGVWHIDKQVLGRRLRGSTGTSSLSEAEAFLTKEIERIRREVMFGERPVWTFKDGAIKYLEEHMDDKRIADVGAHIRDLMPYIGSVTLDKIDDDRLKPFIEKRLKIDGVKPRTVNHALDVAQRIINLAARKWRHNGKSWIASPYSINMLNTKSTTRKPYPLSWDEQRYLLKALPDHLASMALFKVNTGMREQEVCRLEWDWEVKVPELETSVFILPESIVKNGEERLIVLNRVARSVINGQRGKDKVYVFSHNGKHLSVMNNTAWQHGRIRAALAMIAECPDFGGFKVEVDAKSGVATAVGVRNGRRVEERYTYAEFLELRRAQGKAISKRGLRDPNSLTMLRLNVTKRLIGALWTDFSDFSRVRVHDLKHTFGRRLRAAGVPLETRKVLLGHTNGDITTYYSAAELEELLRGAEKVCVGDNPHKIPTLVILKKKAVGTRSATA